MVDKVPAVLELEVDTDHLPRYNMRRAALRPPPSARTRVLAKPEPESTLVQTTPSSAASLLLEVDAAPIRRYKTRGVAAVTALRNCMCSASVFLLTAMPDQSTVTVQRLSTGNTLRAASFDEMVAVHKEHMCVLLLQHLDGDKRRCKLSATVPIGPKP